MQNSDQLWARLVAEQPEFAPFAPAMPNVRYAGLETELTVAPGFIARHALKAAQGMAPATARTWLGRLLTGEPGCIAEAYGYGTLTERDIKYESPFPIENAELFRTTAGHTDLDGRFAIPDVLFDIKSLVQPGDILENLTNRINEELSGRDMVAVPDGLEDFDHRALNHAAFPAAMADVVNNAAIGRSHALPAIGVRYRYVRASSPFWFSEMVLNPYRYAQSNRHLPITDAKQVPRNRRFMFIYVYSELDHPLASGLVPSTVAERAFARRIFIELTRIPDVARRFCSGVDPNVTFQDIARAIGAIMFIEVHQRQQLVKCRAYLNPNANPAQGIATGTIEEITDFDLGKLDLIDGFECDNY